MTTRCPLDTPQRRGQQKKPQTRCPLDTPQRRGQQKKPQTRSPLDALASLASSVPRYAGGHLIAPDGA